MQGRKKIPVCTARGVTQQYLLPMGRGWGVRDAGHNIIKPLHFNTNVPEQNYQQEQQKKMQPVWEIFMIVQKIQDVF